MPRIQMETNGKSTAQRWLTQEKKQRLLNTSPLKHCMDGLKLEMLHEICKHADLQDYDVGKVSLKFGYICSFSVNVCQRLGND